VEGNPPSLLSVRLSTVRGCPGFIIQRRKKKKMPGLEFLNKKGWHTKSFKNVEKKWLAEKREEEERKKMDELKRKYAEEREMMRLRRRLGGGETSGKKERVEWMYRGPAAAAAIDDDPKTIDEYLLGKPIVEETKEKGDFRRIARGSVPGAKWADGAPIRTKNEAFHLRHEDPLVAMRRAKQNELEKVLHHPDTMRKIRKNESELRELKRRARKLAKRAKKKERRRRERSPSSSRERRKRRKRRKRSRSRETRRRRPTRLSREERERRLAEMTADAETHAISRAARADDRVERGRRSTKKEEEADNMGRRDFLTDLRRKAYAVDDPTTTTTTRGGGLDHLRRRRHYQQRDTNPETFLARES